MKKSHRIILVSILILAGLFVPVPTESYEGGTKVYESLTYAVVEWYSQDGIYENTRLYWFPERGIDNLIKIETDIRTTE